MFKLLSHHICISTKQGSKHSRVLFLLRSYNNVYLPNSNFKDYLAYSFVKCAMYLWWNSLALHHFYNPLCFLMKFQSLVKMRSLLCWLASMSRQVGMHATHADLTHCQTAVSELMLTQAFYWAQFGGERIFHHRKCTYLIKMWCICFSSFMEALSLFGSAIGISSLRCLNFIA